MTATHYAGWEPKLPYLPHQQAPAHPRPDDDLGWRLKLLANLYTQDAVLRKHPDIRACVDELSGHAAALHHSHAAGEPFSTRYVTDFRTCLQRLRDLCRGAKAPGVAGQAIGRGKAVAHLLPRVA